LIGRASRWLAVLAGVAVLAITLLVSMDVLMRYFLNKPQLYVDELASFLQVFVIFGGLAYTFLVGGHVRVDLITAHMRPVRRARLRVVTLVMGILLIAIIAWVTLQSTISAFDYDRASTVMIYPLWLPMICIPLGLLLLAVAMGSTLLRQIRALRGPAAGRDEVSPLA
jgi:TRAP-type C4-dicarboxylate transport system permease small subunit